jgi:hypothetical protein
VRERGYSPPQEGNVGPLSFAGFHERRPSTKRDLDPLWGKKKEERKGGGVLENPPLSSLPLLCRTGTKLRLDKKGTLNSSIVIGRKGTSEEREREKGISPRLLS